MAKVYIVIDPKFDSYDLVAAFSTKEKAEDFVNHSGWGFEVAELKIDIPFDKSPKLWEVTLRWDDSQMINCFIHEQLPPFVEYIRFERNCLGESTCDFLIRSETVSGATRAAVEKLKQVKALEKKKFPFLKKRVVQRFPMDSWGDYPEYNYHTGAIILYPSRKLMPGIEASTEVRETAL